MHFYAVRAYAANLDVHGKSAEALIEMRRALPLSKSLANRCRAAIKQQCRKADIAVQFGGDEFAVTFDGLNTNEAARVLDRVQTTLRSQSAIELVALNPMVSIGIAETSEAILIEALIARADEAL
jgi:diguanylate cyclase (GGDEF)-like protein